MTHFTATYASHAIMLEKSMMQLAKTNFYLTKNVRKKIKILKENSQWKSLYKNSKNFEKF